MITPMAKYSFLVFHSDYTGFLQNLRDLGILHVAEKRSEEKPARLESQFQLVKRYEKAIRFLKQRDNIREENHGTFGNPPEILEEFELLQEKHEITEQEIASLRKEIAKLEPWGDYKKENIDI